MKYCSLVFAILLPAAQFVIGQDSPTRKRIYDILIIDSGMLQTRGYLHGITDSTLVVSNFPVRFGANSTIKGSYHEINYMQLSEITVKRRYGAGRGAWKGAIAGIVIGAVKGFMEGGDGGSGGEPGLNMTAPNKAIFYGALGGCAGAGFGSLIGGLVRKKFIIRRNKESFELMRVDVLNMVYGTTITTVNSQQ